MINQLNTMQIQHIKATTPLVLRRMMVVFLLFWLSACSLRNNGTDMNYDWVSQYTLDRTMVEVNTTNAATALETVFQHRYTDSAARASFCQDFTGPVRFLDDSTGYFFVETYRAWMVAHATQPQLVGTNRMDVQDENGKFYVKDMVNTAIFNGYGFVEYYFSNPVSGQTERKIGFVKNIPSAEMFIGSGFYGDSEGKHYTAQSARIRIAESATQCMASGIAGVLARQAADSTDGVALCRDLIDHVRFFDDQSGYFFIYDFSCRNVAHAIQKNLQGQNLYDYQDSRGLYVIRELLAITQSGQGSGHLEYYWNNPVTGNEERKLAFVKKVPGVNYFIGSGIYID